MSEVQSQPPVERRRFPRRWRRGRRAMFGLLAIVALGAGGYLTFWRMGPPVLSRLSPSPARVGQTVMLEGQGFDPSLEGNVVYFGDYSGRLITAGRRQLEVEVPDMGVPAGGQQTVPVKVEVQETKVSNALELVILPPLVPEPGTDVTAEDEAEDERKEDEEERALRSPSPRP
jgi:hypothetical protein